MSFLNLRAVPYYPELSEKLGNEITASIVMTQLEYWFSKKGYAPFYKFLEPVSNKDAKGNEKSTFGYVQGDSWTEELNISKKSFKNAFSKIGVTYNTKSEFDKAEEKFKIGDTEFFYCCYTDRQTRQTYYYRNHKKVDDLCNEITSSKIVYDETPRPFPKKTKKLPKVTSRSDKKESLEITKGNPSIIQEITTGDYQENTTTNQKSISHVEPTQTEVESSSSISKNLNDIKKYLLENVKDIQTCKNIIFIVENQGVTLDRIKLVVEHTNKNKKGLGFIVEALKNNWSIQEAKKEQTEKGRGQKINSEAISTAIESKKEFEQYATEHEILNKLYDNLDSSLKEKVDQLAYKKAIALNPIPSVARTLVKTTTKIQVLKLLRQEGEI